MSPPRNAIVIAARGGAAAKSRLAPAFDAPARDSLTALMLEAMLEALCGTEARVFVVSPTAELLARARAHGAVALAQRAREGLNAAFRAGCAVAFASGADAVACLPGDLPLLDPAELGAAFDAAHAHGAALVCSRCDGGTGALVQRKGVWIEPAFGADSFKRHQNQARARGLAAVEIAAPSLAADIDTPAHVAALLTTAAALPPHIAQRLRALCARTKAAA